MATIGALRTALAGIVDAAPPGGRLLVDLARVTFLSAAGVRFLVQTGERVRANGGVFVVDPISPIAERVMRACGCGNLVDLTRPTPAVVSSGPLPRCPP
jgi:anti-anti-sigma factor